MMKNNSIQLPLQKGTALVTALLIVALASVIATAMLKQQHIDIRRAENMVKGDQTILYLQAGEDWAKQLLNRDLIRSKNDSLSDNWANIDEALDIDGGSMQVTIEDLQGRFNLNNLLDKEGRASKLDITQFRNLLVALELDPELVQPVLDWIDADINVSLPTGAEDQEYLALEQPYRTANAPFVSSSELMLVKGFSREIFDKLAPYIAALPVRVDINVNTASIPVLAAVLGISLAESEDILSSRPERGYQDIAEFRGEQALTGKTVKGVGVTSQFFMTRVIVGLGRYNASQHSVIARNNKEAVLPLVIQRSRAKI
ncbi:MAG: type II secretion system minor pseudopilin GspK [Sulfuriflexus sp.]|nr:type II secretion system minor pseudopilin GspK [Sulfuriflexus sp.]